MTRKPGKHTSYYELRDAQRKAGCAICRLAYRGADRYLDSILYEAVLDPQVRQRLTDSRGFCARHTRMLLQKPGRALGIALIYRDILRDIADSAQATEPSKLRTLWRRLRGDRGQSASQIVHDWSDECPACVIEERTARRHINLLLAHLQDEELFEAYAEGEGLCLPHFLQAIALASDSETWRLLVTPQIDRYRHMLSELDEFIRKRDHRFEHEPYGPEGDVWLRVMNAVNGGAGMGLSAKSGGRQRDKDL